MYNIYVSIYVCHKPQCYLPQIAGDSAVEGVQCQPPVREEHCLIAGMQYMQLHVFHILSKDHLVGERLVLHERLTTILFIIGT